MLPSPTSPEPRLRLAPHVRACHADGQIILLDLQRSRYVAVSAQPALGSTIAGWPAATLPDTSTATTSLTPSQIHRLTAPLLVQGLLTEQPGDALAPLPRLPTPGRSLSADGAASTRPVDWRRACRFYRSASAAALRLRCQSLAGVAEAVARHRAGPPGTGDAFTLDAAQAAVAAYQRLRLFAFTAHDRCLHDALTLVGFLADEGIAAHWVIGVRTRPFGAHAWVQIGDVVLNDQHEQVRRYTPILVV